MSNNTYIIMLFFLNHAVICLIFCTKDIKACTKNNFSEQMLEVISRYLKRKNNKTPLYILHVFPFVL